MSRFGKALSITACALLLSWTASQAHGLLLIDEQFDGSQTWLDLSTAVTWGGNITATSAFEIGPDTGSDDGNALRMTSSAIANTGFGSDELRTFTAIDFIFDAPINHVSTVTTIDLRMRWAAIGGESNRLNVSLVHDYPTDGGGNPTLDLTLDERFDDGLGDPKTHWWGRPAYQARILGGNPNNAPILQYGGGLDVEGEWEANADTWLPGFNSAPGGGSPGNVAADGWVRTDPVASTEYQDIRYIVYPDRQELLVYDEGNAEWVLLGSQNLLSDPDNPDYFNYFETFEGLRLYWRGSGSDSNVFLDSLTLDIENVEVIPEPATASLLLLGALFLRRRRPV